ncbi:MAG: single-stranded DNA-binding protein [Deltaproteobacteria bacterium]|nr:single-stranded DNA-binding protein [Deltaproteobacteria bacterium]
MASVNKVILVGRLGKDPEIRYTQTGKSLVSFTLATSERWAEEERTEWHRILMFEKLAETANTYLRKGDLCYLEGKIQSRSWEDQKGVKHNLVEIICNVMQKLSSPRRGEGDEAGTRQTFPPKTTPNSPPVSEPLATPVSASGSPPATTPESTNATTEIPETAKGPEKTESNGFGEEPLPTDDDLPF